MRERDLFWVSSMQVLYAIKKDILGPGDRDKYGKQGGKSHICSKIIALSFREILYCK